MSQVSSPEEPDDFLAAALERAAARHEAGRFDEIGKEYDQVELETLPFRDRASVAYHFAFRFWDGWVDASNHNWLYYPGIGRDAWPELAGEVVAGLRAHVEPTNPLLQRHFGHQPPGPFSRLWNLLRGQR